MRKLINSTYITLDGVIENPMWTMPYFDEEAAASPGRRPNGADAMLMGRATYDGMSAAWPTMDESDPTTGAAYFNNVKKYVASTTLTDPTWNNTEVLQGDLVEAVTALKAQDGQEHHPVRLRLGHRAADQGGPGGRGPVLDPPGAGGRRQRDAPLNDFKASFELVDTRVHEERRDRRLVPAEGGRPDRDGQSWARASPGLSRAPSATSASKRSRPEGGPQRAGHPVGLVAFGRGGAGPRWRAGRRPRRRAAGRRPRRDAAPPTPCPPAALIASRVVAIASATSNASTCRAKRGVRVAALLDRVAQLDQDHRQVERGLALSPGPGRRGG